MTDPVRSAVESIHPWLVETRRTIHMEPELGFEEHKTSRLVADALESWGLEVRRGVAKTGVVGLLRTGRPGATLGIRADMDALPIEEANDVPYKSRQPGKMHACGHDCHTTMLLGAARILATHPELLAEVGGNVKFLFQPGEEGYGGGKVMVEEGVLKNPRVDLVIAAHVYPTIPVGCIGTRTGPMMAAANKFTVVLRGQGAHAAAPHLSRDPIVGAAHLITALQGIVSRNVDPFDPVVVSVTKVETGSTFNVVPPDAHIQGTVRTLISETREMVRKRMEEIIGGVASAFQLKWEFELMGGYPPLANHAGATRLIETAGREIVGEENLRTAPAVMGGEDFAYYLEQRPGSLFRVGIRNEARGIVHTLHNDRFDLDEDCMPVGVSVFVQAAREYLARPKEYES